MIYLIFLTGWLSLNDYLKWTVYLKKSSFLASDEMTKFMTEALDKQWLLTKHVLVFGILELDEEKSLLNLNLNFIKYRSSLIKVSSKEGKQIPRGFSQLPIKNVHLTPANEFASKYLSLQPCDMNSKRLWIGYREGMCLVQHVSKNMLATKPKNVAEYPGLKNVENYMDTSYEEHQIISR